MYVRWAQNEGVVLRHEMPITIVLLWGAKLWGSKCKTRAYIFLSAHMYIFLTFKLRSVKKYAKIV